MGSGNIVMRGGTGRGGKGFGSGAGLEVAGGVVEAMIWCEMNAADVTWDLVRLS